MNVAALLVALVVAWLVYQAARLTVLGIVLTAALMAGIALGVMRAAGWMLRPGSTG